jgi:hypothetical protein
VPLKKKKKKNTQSYVLYIRYDAMDEHLLRNKNEFLAIHNMKAKKKKKKT